MDTGFAMETDMTKYSRMGVLLLVAIALWCGAVSAVRAQETADLELTKTLETTGPVFAGDQVVWRIELTNNGPDVTDIEVTEKPGDLIVDNAVPGGDTTFDSPGLVWSIAKLAHTASAMLTLITTIPKDAAEGELKNCAAITSPDQHLPDTDTNMAGEVCVPVMISPTREMLDITIKPETLNLKSRGVFTVFIQLIDDSSQEGIILGDLSSVECGGAQPTKLQLTRKDGGTLMAKYRRQELDEELVKAGEEVEITCGATTSAGGEPLKVIGADTIRVIGEKKKGLDAFFAGILDIVLPVDDEAGEEATDDQTATATATPPTPALNRGQLKKAERNGETVCTQDCSAGDSQETRGNGKKSGSEDRNTGTGSGDKGDQGNGNGNGKENSNKPDTEKGNDKNKK
jgi:hypothetical protein